MTATARRAALVLSLLLGPALAHLGCERPRPPPEPPRYLFESRRPYAAQLEAFQKSGGDPTKSLRPQSVADLAGLEVGSPYAYVVLATSVLVVAPNARGKAPAWTHPVLAGGEAVLAAGHLRLERQGDKLVKVFADDESDAYCPSSDTLRAALSSLEALKVPREALRVEHRPALDCVAGPPSVPGSAMSEARVSFGTVMVSVARRFEVCGKAIVAKKYELARYQLEEILETFRDELPATTPPPLPSGVALDVMQKPLVETAVPALDKALVAGDAAAIEAAFATASKSCNACHVAAGKAFIEVPSKPGEGVPKL